MNFYNFYLVWVDVEENYKAEIQLLQKYEIDYKSYIAGIKKHVNDE